MSNFDLWAEAQLQARERREAKERPLHEVLANMKPLTPAQREAQERERAQRGGWGQSQDDNR